MIDDPELIRAAREFLIAKVGLSGAHMSFFLYLLEEEEFAGFRALLERGEAQKADSEKIVSLYAKRVAALREKAVLLADVYGIDDEEERACFLVETVSRRERFLPLERTDARQLKRYAEEVKAGMSAERALKELGLPQKPKIQTIRESFDTED